MTAAAGFWSLLTGTVAAVATFLLYLAGVLPYGPGGVDLKGDVLAGDAARHRSPLLLGGIALALSIAPYVPVW